MESDNTLPVHAGGLCRSNSVQGCIFYGVGVSSLSALSLSFSLLSFIVLAASSATGLCSLD
jgi:hypothetical protein